MPHKTTAKRLLRLEVELSHYIRARSELVSDAFLAEILAWPDYLIRPKDWNADAIYRIARNCTPEAIAAVRARCRAIVTQVRSTRPRISKVEFFRILPDEIRYGVGFGERILRLVNSPSTITEAVGPHHLRASIPMWNGGSESIGVRLPVDVPAEQADAAQEWLTQYTGRDGYLILPRGNWPADPDAIEPQFEYVYNRGSFIVADVRIDTVVLGNELSQHGFATPGPSFQPGAIAKVLTGPVASA